jgi:hypothetical protein
LQQHLVAAGEVVLHIADFLLEFAALRHEEAADVPNFIHPMVPNEVRLPTPIFYIPWQR